MTLFSKMSSCYSYRGTYNVAGTISGTVVLASRDAPEWLEFGTVRGTARKWGTTLLREIQFLERTEGPNVRFNESLRYWQLQLAHHPSDPVTLPSAGHISKRFSG